MLENLIADLRRVYCLYRVSTDIFYVQSSKFFSGIQQYILQIKESLRFICGRVNFDFATYTVCRGDHANF